MDNKLITNCQVLTMSEKYPTEVFSGSVGIKGDTISYVGVDVTGREFLDRCDGPVEEIDGNNMLAMPGLVNTHNHISMTLLRGYADDIPLMAWLNDHVWPFEAKLTRSDIKAGAMLGIAEMLVGGTTTSADMYWMEEAVGEAAEQTGIRIVLGPTFTDLKWEEFKEDMGKIKAKYLDSGHPTISAMVAPHSPYTCSGENLIKAKKLSDELGIGYMIHVSETLDEQNVISDRYGKTPIEYLDGLGILEPGVLIIHGVHINDNDIEIMARRGVSMAFNPQSNMKLASGIAPAWKAAAAGVNVSIGTDGACSNNDLDMWEELRTGSFLQKVSSGDPCVFGAYDILRAATVNGAKALGLEESVGKLEPGMKADIILIDLQKPHFYPRHNIVANLAYCGKASDVHTVFVNGKKLVEQCKLTGMDMDMLLRDAGQASNK